jgi:hypothetical protein
MTMPTVVPDAKGVRLCVQDDDGVIRKVARINWTNADASLYIESYCPPGGKAYAGRFTMPLGEPSFSWDFTGQLEAEDAMPKMSLHQSGRTKCELGGAKTKFVIGKPLFDLAGGHIATIQTFNPRTLPVMDNKAPRRTPNTLVAPSEAGCTSVRFPIAVSLTAPPESHFKFVVTFTRPILQTPLYVGVGVFGRHEPENDGDGVVVFGGWGPGIRPSEVTDMAFTATRSLGG